MNDLRLQCMAQDKVSKVGRTSDVFIQFTPTTQLEILVSPLPLLPSSQHFLG